MVTQTAIANNTKNAAGVLQHSPIALVHCLLGRLTVGSSKQKQNLQAYHFVHEPAALNLEDKAMLIWQNVKTANCLDRVWVRVSQIGKVGEVMLAYEEVCSLPAGAQHFIKSEADKGL